jgi:IclR family KDG regulon transcriptional repressor
VAESKNPSYLKVVAKTFRLVETMRQGSSSVRLSDLSRTLKQPKATVFRILYTLNELGYVRQDPATEAYLLTERFSRFMWDETDGALKGAARAFMERLLHQYEETVNLAVFDHDRVIYAEILEGLRGIRMTATVNTCAPLHATALGKSILAFLEPEEAEEILKRTLLTKFTETTIVDLSRLMAHLRSVRARGFAVDNEEIERGARCVAAPILNHQRRPVAAISVSGPITHIQRNEAKQIGEAVVDCCLKVSKLMGCPDLKSSR